jgi:uncharacterized caspase-like protein
MKKLLILVLAFLFGVQAQAAERRIALVIGNANYQSGALPTSANDAGLIAQTLQAAGFDVSGARDLDQESLRRAFHDFLDKASAGGQDTVAYIYLSGYGIQLEGENYFAPVDARIATDANVSSEAVRLSDYLKPLAALRLKASIVVLDLARANPFAKSSNPLTSGLALVEADQNTLIAFNAAPGTVAPNEAGPYSAYAQAVAEISREGGLGIDEVFTRVRLRVNELTKGAEVPWQSTKLEQPFYLFERAPDAPQPAISAEQTSSIRTKPIREFDARDAYLAALDRDTLQGYLDFITAYPNDPLVPRVRAIIAARREAITWRRTRNVDTPRAYWSYLRRYSRGAHSYDARRRLRVLAAAFEPSSSFEAIEYDVPPPPPDEIIYIARPVLVFDDPEFDFVPPPPPPVIFLPPPPVYFIDLPPPPPPLIAFVLPIPEYRPVPVWVVPPPQIVPPPTNIIYNNIHNTVVINNTTNMVSVTNPQGQTQTMTPAAASGAGTPSGPASPGALSRPGVVAGGVAALGAAALLAPSLPPSLARKAATTPNPPAAQPAKPLAPGRVLRVQSTAPITQPSQTPPNAPATGPAATTPSNLAPPAATVTPSSRQPQTKPQIGQPLPGAPSAQPLPPSNLGPTTRQTGRPARRDTSRPAGQIGTAPPPAQSTSTPLQAPSDTARPGRSPSPPTSRSAPSSARAPIEQQRPKTSVTPPKQTAPAAPRTPRERTIERQQAPVSRPAPHAPGAAPAARPSPPPITRPAPPASIQARPAAPPRPVAPPAAARPAPPPPAVVRLAPSPPPAARPAPPPPQAARPAPPPAAARPAPPAGKPAQKCVLPNGQPCPAR